MPAGRIQGSMNRATKESRDLMAREGFHPIFEMIMAYRDPTTSENLKIFCLRELVRRHTPELRMADIGWLGDVTAEQAPVKSITLNFGDKPEEDSEEDNG